MHIPKTATPSVLSYQDALFGDKVFYLIFFFIDKCLSTTCLLVDFLTRYFSEKVCAKSNTARYHTQVQRAVS